MKTGKNTLKYYSSEIPSNSKLQWYFSIKTSAFIQRSQSQTIQSRSHDRSQSGWRTLSCKIAKLQLVCCFFQIIVGTSAMKSERVHIWLPDCILKQNTEQKMYLFNREAQIWTLDIWQPHTRKLAQCCQLSDFSDPPSDFFPKKRLVTNLATSWTNLSESLWSLVLPQRREVSAHAPLSLRLLCSASVWEELS